MSVNQRQPDGTLKKIAGLGQYDVPIDSSLSPTSTNPVQNKVITEELLKKATQYATLPTASSANEGAIVQYIGTDSTNYSIGGFYQCQEDSGAYSWVLLSQQITVDSALSPTSENPVQNKVINTALSGKLDSNKVGVASGVAGLDSNGKVPSSQLPSYVDDIIEGYYNETDGKFYEESTYTTEITGETGKIYISLDTNLPYRWSGSAFVQIPWGLALGETSSTAYRGDRGKTAYDHSQTTSGNPHNVTKSDVGLGNVGNFKAVSTVASQGLTDTEKSNARTNIGVGNATLTIQKNGTTVKTFTSNATSDVTCNITMAKSDVGLGNVGNFKAVSTVASQGLSSTEQANARANIGAGTSSLTIGTTASTAAAGDHTHTLNIAAGGTASINLAANTAYTLTAGGSTYVFKTPSDANSVTGVKGNSESSYRTGNVNITASNIGLGNVGNFKAVSTVASQGLSTTEQTNARSNIGAAAASSITNMQEQYYQTAEPSPSKVGAVWIG